MYNGTWIGLPMQNITLIWEGFTTTAEALATAGWEMELKFNRYSHKTKIFARHPLTRHIACGEVGLPGEPITLKFLVQEYNGRIKPPRQFVERDEAIHFKRWMFTKEDVGFLLETIRELQYPKQKEFLKEVKEYQLRNREKTRAGR